MAPNAVESHLSCFAKHPEAGFVVGDIDQISLDGSYVGSPRWPLLEANHYEELLRVNHVANTIAVMFRRSVIERVGGSKAFYQPAEDYELLLRGDYGLTCDEGVGSWYGRLILRWYASLFRNRDALGYYDLHFYANRPELQSGFLTLNLVGFQDRNPQWAGGIPTNDIHVFGDHLFA